MRFTQSRAMGISYDFSPVCVSVYLCICASVCQSIHVTVWVFVHDVAVCACFKMQQMRQINATIKLY